MPLPWADHALFRVTAHALHWSVAPLSKSAGLVVRDLEDLDQYVWLAPGRGTAAMPFELARIDVWAGEALRHVTVFGPEPGAASSGGEGLLCRYGDQSPPVSPGTRYAEVARELLAVVADTGRLPSAADISDRLRDRGIVVSPRAVRHHLDHTARRLGIVQGVGAVWLGQAHALWAFLRLHDTGRDTGRAPCAAAPSAAGADGGSACPGKA